MADHPPSPPSSESSRYRWIIGGSVLGLLVMATWVALHWGPWGSKGTALLIGLPFGSVALWELGKLLQRILVQGGHPSKMRLGLGVANVLWICAVLAPQWGFWALWVAILLLTLGALRGPLERATQSLGAYLIQLVWVILPIIAALQVWSLHPQGPLWILWMAVVVKGADTMAYLVGRRWGTRPFFPCISPKKTQEGFAAALLFGLLWGGAGLVLFGLGSGLEGMGLGVVLALLGAFGDLGESVLKRQASIKDSGSLPGIGGLLDILDALLPCMPILWIWLRA